MFMDLKIKELSESKDELGELIANVQTCMKENSTSPRKDSTSLNRKSRFCHKEKLGELEGNMTS